MRWSRPLHTPPSLPVVDIFSKPDCHLCDDAKALLTAMQSRHAFILREVNIADQAELLTQYGEEIPVIFIDGHKAFKYRIDPQQFVRHLQRRRVSSQRTTRWQRLWRP